MKADARLLHDVRPNPVTLRSFFDDMKHLGREVLSARGTGTPPPCACGAPFTSFRARKEHIRACDGKPKAWRNAMGPTEGTP